MSREEQVKAAKDRYLAKPGIRAKIAERARERRSQDPENAKRIERRWYQKADIRLLMLKRARTRAAQKGLAFTLTKDDISVPDVCPLLGIPLEKGASVTLPGSPSIDRKDPRLGYTPDNVWVVSFRANSIKNDATLLEFKSILLAWEAAT